MHSSILDLEKDYKKPQLVSVRSGDTVRVTQKIREASKERLQAFEGLVIRVDRANSMTCRITLRRVASGVWVEKSFLVHSPNVVRIEVVRRAKVRRNYLSYMRQRIGKAARLKGVDFDKAAVNEFAQATSPLSIVKDEETEGAVVSDGQATGGEQEIRETEVAAEEQIESSEIAGTTIQNQVDDNKDEDSDEDDEEEDDNEEEDSDSDEDEKEDEKEDEEDDDEDDEDEEDDDADDDDEDDEETKTTKTVTVMKMMTRTSSPSHLI